jgi:predicted nucleotidyltransferase
MAPLDHYLGLLRSGRHYGDFGTPFRETMEGFVDEYDIVSYEFKKMMIMLMVNNPNVLSLLSLRPEFYINVTSAGELLLKHRHLFFSQKAHESFVKYAEDQLFKMTRLAFKGYMGTKRRELVKKFGYDTKNAAHCIRLLRTCIEFLDTGELNVYRDKDAEELLDIKLGNRSLESVKSESKDLRIKADLAKVKSSLPLEPNYQGINELTKQIVYNYIKENQDICLNITDVSN